MAKGNWKPEVIKPCSRCWLCGGKITTTVFRDGPHPVHKECLDKKLKERE